MVVIVRGGAGGFCLPFSVTKAFFRNLQEHSPRRLIHYFCTLADDFDDDDKAFFRDLVDAGIKIIMLTRFFLEMGYYELMKYRHDKDPGRSRTKADWLMRANDPEDPRHGFRA